MLEVKSRRGRRVGGRVSPRLLLLLLLLLLLVVRLLLLEHDLHADGLLHLLLFLGAVGDAGLNIELVGGGGATATGDHEVIAPVACHGRGEEGREGEEGGVSRELHLELVGGGIWEAAARKHDVIAPVACQKGREEGREEGKGQHQEQQT